MINLKILDAVLKAAKEDIKDTIIKEIIKSISYNYDYNDAKQSHILEMLVDKSAIITKDNVNLKYIEEHKELLMYEHEKEIFKNITIAWIDNIECYVRVNFEYIDNIYENRDDIGYTKNNVIINFIDHPEILK